MELVNRVFPLFLDRRTGGLETARLFGQFLLILDRRTGGLEN